MRKSRPERLKSRYCVGLGRRILAIGFGAAACALIASLLPSLASAEPAMTFQNKSQGMYLAAQPSGPVLATQPSTPDAQWIFEQVHDGGVIYLRLKSATTGGYLNIEHGALEIGPAQPGWLSAMWRVVPSPTGDGSYRLQNRWKSDIYIDAGQNGIAAGPVQPGSVSADWDPQLVTNATVAGGIGPTVQPQGQQQPNLQQPDMQLPGAPQTQTASQPTSDTVQIVVVNLQYPKLDVIHVDEQGEMTAFGSVAGGQTLREVADPNGWLRFAANGAWIGDPYAITNGSIQTLQVQGGQIIASESQSQVRGQGQAQVADAQQQPAPGSVQVAVTNRFGRTVTLTEMPTTPGGQPRAVTDLPSQQSTFVWLLPGTELGAWDEGTQTYQGMTYPVTAAAQGQSVTIPFVRPGSVKVTMRNTTQSELVCQEVPDTGSPTALFSIAPGAVVAQYVGIGKKLGFAADGKWVGGSYVVTSSPNQSLSLPIAQGDLDANGVVSQDEIAKIANAVAVAIAQKMQEDKNKPDACWKNTYGRGVGVIPTMCSGNAANKDGLCYTNCQPGYRGAVTMCVPDCPPGFRDDGLYCYKPAPITRSTFAWQFGDGLNLDNAMARCRASPEGRRYGCENANANTIVYTKCPASYQQAPVITNLCTPTCPPNTTDIGISCQKNTYDRGVGRIPDCGGGTPQKDAGLCYKTCSPGYNGIGPVCWSGCPTGWADCGAMCGRTHGACANAITMQVTSVAQFALSVGLIAVTAGSAAGVTTAARAGETAAEVAGKEAAKVAAQETARATLRSQVRAALSSATGRALTAAGKELLIDTAISDYLAVNMPMYMALANAIQFRNAVKAQVVQQLDAGISDAQINSAVAAAVQGASAHNGYADNFDYTLLDPTGIADVVTRFNMPMCASVTQ